MSEKAITPSPGLVRNEQTFADIVALISASRLRALQAVNTALMELYWQIGEIISRKLERAEWGDSVVEELARYISRTHPGLRGFTRANLFRMRQFYETYRQEEKVAPLVRQLPWSHNLVILGQTKRPEEREFYLRFFGDRRGLESSRTRAADANWTLRTNHPVAAQSLTRGATNPPGPDRSFPGFL
jgi:predicted nuclease of restriction endonuclease-like (RecB) superfamily